MIRNNFVRALALSVLAFAALAATPLPSHAQVYSSWDPWARWTSGPWAISNNVWGKNPGPQGLYVNSVNNWYVESWQWSSNVESAPNISIDPGKTLDHLSQADAWYSISSPGDATYDWIFDLWMSPTSTFDPNSSQNDEVEVYLNHTTPVGGWGKQIRGALSIPFSNGQSLGVSQVWQVTPTFGGSAHNIIMIFQNNQFQNNQYIDTLAIMRWCKQNGLLNYNVYSQMGFACEIWNTNYYEDFTCNTYTATVKDGSGNQIGHI